MNKRIILTLTTAIAIFLMFIIAACAPNSGANPQPAPASAETDPQKLMIPRWFLSALTLDGQAVEIPAGQQQMTIQFETATQANGTGGCNSFGADYQASQDGKLTFGPIVTTEMACEGWMQLESAYYQALGKVQQFRVGEGKLTLSSSDGKTTLVFAMPPKWRTGKR
ncbi:MAG: META domain-containing protein [Chloroflexi bacterium]|nr:MAG: META domain-containing protein [Chloroflexota bacterium]